MRVVTTGSRKWTNKEKIAQTIMAVNARRKIEVAQGGAAGADTLVKEVCEEHGIPCKPYEADWDAYAKTGKRNPAGVIRNTEMIKDFEPKLGLAFFKIGELNKGTMDAVVKMLNKGVRVLITPD